MLLTLVIPVYNVRDYLDECLSSLPSNCKVVLVNDGSTDGSELICRQYAELKENTIVVDKPNGGLADARNFGMRYVDTPYVFFLDSDDRVDGDNLMRSLGFAIENDLDWLQCGYAYDYGDHLLVYKKDHRPEICEKIDIVLNLVNDRYVKNFAWGKIYRTSIVRQFEFPKGKFFEDSYWQYLIIDQCASFGVFPELVTYYRQREDSISGSFSDRNLDLLEGLSQRLDFYIENSVEYACVIGDAAVNLWQNAEMVAKLSRRSSPDLVKRYNATAKTTKERYRPHILAGIVRKPLFTRLELKARFKEHRRLSAGINLMRRVLGRFTTSVCYHYIKIEDKL